MRSRQALDNPDPPPELPVSVVNNSMAYRRPLVTGRLRTTRRSIGIGPTSRRGRRVARRAIRRMKRRFKRSMKRIIRTPFNVVPPKMLVKCHYVNHVAYPATGIPPGVITWFDNSGRIKANSVHHPSLDVTTGGRFDQDPSMTSYCATFYNRTRVLMSKIKYTFRQSNNKPTSDVVYPFVVGVVLNHDLTPAMTSWEQLSGRLNANYRIAQNSSDVKNGKFSFRMRFSAKKRFGPAGSSLNIAAVNTDPIDTEYYLPFIQVLDPSVEVFPAWFLNISVTYYVEYFDRGEIADMPVGMSLLQS